MKKHLLIAIFIIITISAFLLASCDKKTSKNNGEADEKETEMSFYEYCYSKASGQKQIDELDELSEDESLGWGEWRRDALIIIGELPKDIGRVTLDDAEKIVDKDMGDSENIAYFNEIAGAPDWMGGSGIGRAIYYLNDEKTEAVMCILGEVNYFVIKENGEYVQLPIGNQVLPEPEQTEAKAVQRGTLSDITGSDFIEGINYVEVKDAFEGRILDVTFSEYMESGLLEKIAHLYFDGNIKDRKTDSEYLYQVIIKKNSIEYTLDIYMSEQGPFAYLNDKWETIDCDETIYEIIEIIHGFSGLNIQKGKPLSKE